MQSRRLSTFWYRYDLPVLEKALGLEASKEPKIYSTGPEGSYP